MVFPWYAAAMLALESQGVVALRLMKMAGGGKDARNEAELMVIEKVDALVEASVCHAVADTRQLKSASLFTGLNRSSASITA